MNNGGNSISPKFENEATIQMYNDYYSPENDSNRPYNKTNTDPLFGMLLSEIDHKSQIRKKENETDLMRSENLSGNENANYGDNDAVMNNGKKDDNEIGVDKEKENKMISSTQFEDIRL